jgi:hypothetical protein
MWSGIRAALVLGIAAVALAPLAPLSPAAGQAPVTGLSGTLAVDAGACRGGVTGSYFRMILPTGNAGGPFLANGDSGCADQTYTLLVPGSDGGLVLGGHQPEAAPAFDGAGNSRSNRVTQPTPFFGVAFSTSTNPADPQTGVTVPAPALAVADDGSITGDLRAFAASWNNQEFNQGAPKPDGSRPGNTAGPSGTYDAATGRYTLEWTSQIAGGPFDRFTGLWHLEGRVVAPAAAGPGTGGAPVAGGSDTGGTATAGPAGAGGATATADAGAPTTASVAGAAADAVLPGSPSASGGAVDGTRILSSGRAPAGWLVVLVAVVGVLAFAAFVVIDRTLRRTEAEVRA